MRPVSARQFSLEQRLCNNAESYTNCIYTGHDIKHEFKHEAVER